MNKEILRLAGPNIISNISVPLLSTVDTILMGHLSAAHLGAVGIGSMIFNFIYWNFGFLRMGTTGMTAQAFGRDDRREISDILGRSCCLGLLVALILLIFYYPIGEISYFLMNVSEEQHALVKTYFTIRILAAPATLMLYSLFGWYFGMQNAIAPLVLTIFINLINILVSAVLVLYYGYGVSGVAWGTTIAQYGGLLLAIIILRSRYGYYLKIIKKESLFRVGELRNFLRINRDLFIRTLCLTLAFGFFYSQSSKSGELILAANVILLQFLNWMAYGIDGFAFAAESLVGKYYGAGNRHKTKQAINYSFIWGGFLAVLYAVFFYFGGDHIISIFTTDKNVIEFTLQFIIWTAILPIAGFASFIWDGIFIGFTASKAMRDAMFIALAIYFVSYYLALVEFPSHALWIAMIVFLFARGVIQAIYFWIKGWNMGQEN